MESGREQRQPADVRQEEWEAPRIALFLFDCYDASRLASLLQGIPPLAAEAIQEVVVMLDRPDRGHDLAAPVLAAGHPFEVRIHHPPRALEWGALRKAAFEYGLRLGFDRLLLMRGDGRHPPELLTELIGSSVQHPRSLVVGSRFATTRMASRGALPLVRALGLRLAHAGQNAILNLEVEDYQSSYRVYPREALLRIPWQLNSDRRFFDDEVLVQFRALGESIVGVSIGKAWPEHDGAVEALRYAVEAMQVPIGYRLHQLHLTRHHRYMVDRDIHYTLKLSPTGSHMQIVEAIAPGSRVLDLGCSQGLLARPLRERGVRVSGVDARPHEGVSEELETYYRRDLEQDLELPEERDFDCVVVADVIEHIRNRQRLLRSVRRYLKPEGRLIISTPNIAIWFYRLSLLVGRFEYGPRGVLDADHVHLYTRATFQREVEAAGFRVVKRRVTALPFEVVFEATGRSKAVRAVADLYYLLARAWPSMFAYQHILEAEITTLDEESISP
jgi:methionine biosynthesis protein MetW